MTACVLHLDLDPEPVLEGTPRLQRLLEQHAGIDRDDPHGVGPAADAQQLVEQHRLLLLEGAQQHGAHAVALDRLAQRAAQAVG